MIDAGGASRSIAAEPVGSIVYIELTVGTDQHICTNCLGRPRGGDCAEVSHKRCSGKLRALPPDRLSDRYLLQQLAALRPPDSIVVEEAPSSRGAMHDYLPMLEPDSFYTCASGGLGRVASR